MKELPTERADSLRIGGADGGGDCLIPKIAI
jgi:hypothetical protein